jgi:hypothetical protein
MVDLSVIHGRIIVRDGELIGQDLVSLITRHNQIARAIARGEQP